MKTCVTLPDFSGQGLLQKVMIKAFKEASATDAETKPVPNTIGVQHDMEGFAKASKK